MMFQKRILSKPKWGAQGVVATALPTPTYLTLHQLILAFVTMLRYGNMTGVPSLRICLKL